MLSRPRVLLCHRDRSKVIELVAVETRSYQVVYKLLCMLALFIRLIQEVCSRAGKRNSCPTAVVRLKEAKWTNKQVTYHGKISIESSKFVADLDVNTLLDFRMKTHPRLRLVGISVDLVASCLEVVVEMKSTNVFFLHAPKIWIEVTFAQDFLERALFAIEAASHKFNLLQPDHQLEYRVSNLHAVCV